MPSAVEKSLECSKKELPEKISFLFFFLPDKQTVLSIVEGEGMILSIS